MEAYEHNEHTCKIGNVTKNHSVTSILAVEGYLCIIEGLVIPPDEHDGNCTASLLQMGDQLGVTTQDSLDNFEDVSRQDTHQNHAYINNNETIPSSC